MLRLTALILLLLNAAYLAWSQGWLRAYGLAPVAQSEPQRLTQQIRPESIRILSRQEVLSPSAKTPCLQIGPYSEAQAKLLAKAMEGWPAGSWALESITVAPRWLVYMGRFADNAGVARKAAELQAIGVPHEVPGLPELLPGLVLAALDSKAQADAELAALAQRGVRTARVVQESAPMAGRLLRFPAADAALQARLTSMQVLFAGKLLQPCDAKTMADSAPGR